MGQEKGQNHLNPQESLNFDDMIHKKASLHPTSLDSMSMLQSPNTPEVCMD